MMVIWESVRTRKLVLLAVGLTLALSVVCCASGPLGSHGVDYVPAFDTPMSEGEG
jgi:hypothetical protein